MAMAGLKKYFWLAVAAGIILIFFSPVFLDAPSKNIASIAIAKKVAKKSAKKSKKKKNEIKQAFISPVYIVGDADCVRKTNQALSILQEKSPGDFDKVAANLGIVECSQDGSGTFVWESPARFKAGFSTYQADASWYASALVHESCHISQYRSYLSSHIGQQVPAEIFSGAEAESECLLVQYNALERLGASQTLLDYTKKIAQTSYWDLPYEKRWW